MMCRSCGGANEQEQERWEAQRVQPRPNRGGGYQEEVHQLQRGAGVTPVASCCGTYLLAGKEHFRKERLCEEAKGQQTRYHMSRWQCQHKPTLKQRSATPTAGLRDIPFHASTGSVHQCLSLPH